MLGIGLLGAFGAVMAGPAPTPPKTPADPRSPARRYEGVTSVPEPTRAGPSVARGSADEPGPTLEGASRAAASPTGAGSPAQPPPAPAPPATRAAAESPADDAPPEPDRTWTAGAFVDTAYIVNSNFPDNHLYRGAFTTPRTGEFTVELAVAHLDHPAIPAEPWRLQLAFQAGATADSVWADEPIPGGDDGRLAGPEVWKHLGLANAGFLVRRTKTEIAGGILAAPFGIGALWSKDNWNHSPSWMANGSPYYLAGGAIRQELPAGFALHGWVVNGWQTVGDTNEVPSYLAGATWAKGDLSAGTWALFGPETSDIAPRAWRLLSDTTIAWNKERFGIAGIVDVGRERVTTLPSESLALWVGGALFVRGRPWQGEHLALELSARPEVYWDRDGRIYGVPQALASATGTVGFDLFSHLLLRVEYRYDHSTADDGFFFAGDAASPDASGLARQQHTVFFAMVGYFSRAFALRAPAARRGS